MRRYELRDDEYQVVIDALRFAENEAVLEESQAKTRIVRELLLEQHEEAEQLPVSDGDVRYGGDI